MEWVKTIDKLTDITIVKNSNCSDAKKDIVILSGLHGDEIEIAPIFKNLCRKLLHLRIFNKFNVILVPFVNIDGIKTKTRNDPNNRVDLNRTFNLIKSPKSTRLIKNIIQNAALVIDIHCFPDTNHALTALLFTTLKNKAVNSININLVKIFRADFVWHLHFNSVDKEKQGSLGEFLTRNNIPNFAIETITPEFAGIKDTNRLTRSLIRVIEATETDFSRKILRKNNLNIVKRNVILSKSSGVFVPLSKVFDSINKKTVIGKIIGLDLRETNVISNTSGRIIFIKSPIFVEANEKLCGVGEKE